MKQVSRYNLIAFLLIFPLASGTSMAGLSDVGVDVNCPNSAGVNGPLDVDVTLTAGNAAIDLTGKRVMVALSSNPNNSLTRIRTFGPFARTIPDEVTIINGNIALLAYESVDMQVNVLPSVPKAVRGTVSHVMAFLIDESGKVGDNGSCMVPIQ